MRTTYEVGTLEFDVVDRLEVALREGRKRFVQGGEGRMTAEGDGLRWCESTRSPRTLQEREEDVSIDR
jgi:hypothetical protein